MAKISDRRKAAYYGGNAISVLGVILFFSVFISAAMNFGNFDDFGARGRSMGLRAFGGMFLIFVGQAIANIGAKGLAGSGIILDPEEAREDLKPYSHQAGGMLSDTLEKAELGKHLGGIGSGSTPERVIMIKCRDCEFLNEENSKFCQECGSAI